MCIVCLLSSQIYDICDVYSAHKQYDADTFQIQRSLPLPLCEYVRCSTHRYDIHDAPATSWSCAQRVRRGHAMAHAPWQMATHKLKPRNDSRHYAWRLLSRTHKHTYT